METLLLEFKCEVTLYFDKKAMRKKKLEWAKHQGKNQQSTNPGFFLLLKISERAYLHNTLIILFNI